MNVSYLFDYDIVVKVLIVGDSGCGKSCMLMKYADESFSPEHISTIGVDFKITSMERNDKKIKLQLWDSAGQERFKAITATYYRGCHAIVLTYDVTSKDSFNNLPMWMDEINNNIVENTPVFLVGNKSDLIYHRMVSKQDGISFAEEHKLNGFLETSAKTGTGLHELFDQIVDSVIAKMPVKNNADSNLVKKGVNIVSGGSSRAACCSI